jgi:hypothetical protein
VSITEDSAAITSPADVAHLVNEAGASTRHARMIVLIALGGVFLDAYDLTSLAYGETDVAREFGLGPAGLGAVVSAISFGVLVGSFLVLQPDFGDRGWWGPVRTRAATT